MARPVLSACPHGPTPPTRSLLLTWGLGLEFQQGRLPFWAKDFQARNPGCSVVLYLGLVFRQGREHASLRVVTCVYGLTGLQVLRW